MEMRKKPFSAVVLMLGGGFAELCGNSENAVGIPCWGGFGALAATGSPGPDLMDPHVE